MLARCHLLWVQRKKTNKDDDELGRHCLLWVHKKKTNKDDDEFGRRCLLWVHRMKTKKDDNEHQLIVIFFGCTKRKQKKMTTSAISSSSSRINEQSIKKRGQIGGSLLSSIGTKKKINNHEPSTCHCHL
jgi:hypothetical protein